MLSKDDVLAVAKLSRLELTEPQIEKFGTQLSNVLELFDELKSVDTENTLETSQVTGLKNITREDAVFYDDDLRPSSTDELLKNVPVRRENNIIVPKIIDSSGAGEK